MADSVVLKVLKLLGTGIAILWVFWSTVVAIVYICELYEESAGKKYFCLILAYIFHNALLALVLYGIRKDDPKLIIPWLVLVAVAIPIVPFGLESLMLPTMGILILVSCILVLLYIKMKEYQTPDVGNVYVY